MFAQSLDEDSVFAESIREFLADKFTPDLKRWASRQVGISAEPAFIKAWRKILYDQGWAAPSWPKEYGGTGWSREQVAIFHYECARAGVPHMVGTSTDLCGPVIMKFGTDAQKDFFLPRILSGEHYWCQGYSEPNAGSDLASLRTNAVRADDRYVVNGSKIWTTHAHAANWIFLLARTGKGEKAQDGISFFVSPMDAPGITVRPIISMSGEHELNQVFFENVAIPFEHRIGLEGSGWTVAKFLLENERGGGAFSVERLRVAVQRIEDTATDAGGDTAAILSDPFFRRRLSWLQIEVAALESLERRFARGLSATGLESHAFPSIRKLLASEKGQAIAALEMDALGPYAAADQRAALLPESQEAPIGAERALAPTARYLNGRAASIFAGTNEIQKNILARKALGL